MEFILPQADDPIQIVFLTSIVMLMVGTMFSAHRTARTISWEKKWDRGTAGDGSDDLDIEHGSVTDLWNAVATAPEKLAEIMPGMLLVIGLLGTFLGLGLALNKASSILGQADAMSAGAAADSMNHLMGLLQGLGTKFKTSTWGIAGFVLLKIWSEVTRFEEKRLAWVIGKVKRELENRKKDEVTTEARKHETLHRQIAAAANQVVSGLAEHIGEILSQEKKQHQQLLERFDKLYLGQGNLKTELCAGVGALHGQLTTSTNLMLAGVQEQALQSLELEKTQHQKIVERFDGLRIGQRESLLELRASKEAMAQFSDGMLAVVENMAAGSERMVEGADKIGDAADRMGLGADKVGVAANGLVNAVDEFQSQFSEVLNDVRRDLGAAIQDMSVQAAGTLEKGSAQLSDATREISTALGVLSEDVKNTMNEVKESIGDALKIQQKASEEFTLSSRVLNENIEATTSIVGKLARPIEDGLRAVSDSGLHMRSVGRSLDKSLDGMQRVAERLDFVPDALKPLTNFHEQQQEVISALNPLRDLQDNQRQILKEMKGLRGDLVAQQALKDMSPVEA